MKVLSNLKTICSKMIGAIKAHPVLALGVLVLAFTSIPALGFCDINAAFGETKEQVESIVSNRSGLFWIFMAIILGSGIWSLFRGSWKGVGIALLIGVVLGNFSDVIDTVLNTKIFKNKTEHHQDR